MLRQNDSSDQSQPFFYDVTLRDGNQSLLKPWNYEEKEKIFNLLCEIGVHGVEVGFPNASDIDFYSTVKIAELAPEGMVIGGLARAREDDIVRAIKALSFSKKAIARIHTFVGMSPHHMKNVLGVDPNDVRKIAVEAVKIARSGIGDFGQVQFSAEHFGDCGENIDWVIDALLEIVEAGADVINLPNTVERRQPSHFTGLVSKVVAALPRRVIAAVHCHNDLGMATATTVESFFAGVKQLEVTLNGLGERAGNTSLYEVAIALMCNNIAVGLRLNSIYKIALQVAQLSDIPISVKSPLIGADAFKHRSGIHQYGALKTQILEKGAYRPIDPKVVGRVGEEECEFTSQSGYSAVAQIIRESGRFVTDGEARILQPALKAASESRGTIIASELVAAYDAYKNLIAKKSRIDGADLASLVDDVIGGRRQMIWELEDFQVMTGRNMMPTAVIKLRKNGTTHQKNSTGDGAVDAAFNAIREVVGINPEVIHYSITGITEGGDAQGKACIVLRLGDKKCDGQYADTDIVNASIRAYINALNNLLVS